MQLEPAATSDDKLQPAATRLLAATSSSQQQPAAASSSQQQPAAASQPHPAASITAGSINQPQPAASGRARVLNPAVDLGEAVEHRPGEVAGVQPASQRVSPAQSVAGLRKRLCRLDHRRPCARAASVRAQAGSAAVAKSATGKGPSWPGRSPSHHGWRRPTDEWGRRVGREAMERAGGCVWVCGCVGVGCVWGGFVAGRELRNYLA